jgi:hypothetical protein
MQNILTYNTSFFDDSFAISKHGYSIGKLFKSSWFGWSVDIKCNGTDYRIERKGLFQQNIIITDRRQGKEIIKATVKMSMFGFYSKAKANFIDGRNLQWKQKGIFNRSWDWTENEIVIIRATEDNRLFSLKGEINFTNEMNENELLGLLGLYLRSCLSNQSGITLWLGIIVLILLILRGING